MCKLWRFGRIWYRLGESFTSYALVRRAIRRWKPSASIGARHSEDELKATYGILTWKL